ncbi:ubiquitin carboxyl-terminal hydrolase [Geopyxis carbonaria]|nr:ubiquitin carboxyl-terminal hydrolase [Geopyxis carbonaria]
MASPTKYVKHFIPLESNPSLFTTLAHKLGLTCTLNFVDILTLTPDTLAYVARPATALIFVFPTTPRYEAQKAEFDAARSDYTGAGEEDVVWFKQTINNACGLYGILHAMCNGGHGPSVHVEAGSTLDEILKKGTLVKQRVQALETSQELEMAYESVALLGDTEPPQDAEEEVDYHYVAIVKGNSGELYELDGDSKGPIQLGISMGEEEDLLADERVLGIMRRKIDMEQEGDMSWGFNIMALVPRDKT